jgi:hypothetical protein
MRLERSGVGKRGDKDDSTPRRMEEKNVSAGPAELDSHAQSVQHRSELRALGEVGIVWAIQGVSSVGKRGEREACYLFLRTALESAS